MIPDNTTGQQPTLDQLAGKEPMPQTQAAPQAVAEAPPIVEQQPEPPQHDATLEFRAQPQIYRDGNNLVLTGGAVMPSNLCVKTGKVPKTMITAHLLHPMHPGAWFKRDHNTTIGLSAQALEKHRINQALFLALIILGVIMVPVGLLSGLTASGIFTAVVGVLICFAGLVIRAMNPIWSPSSKEDEIIVRGCGEPYLSQFGEKPQS